jgi:hypothetical protein
MSHSKYNDFCEEHKVWVLKYKSKKQQNSLFFIWYCDTDDVDRLLTYKSGRIFGVKSIENLKTEIIAQKLNLQTSSNLILWLSNVENLEIKEDCTYDVDLIKSGFEKGKLDVSVLEEFSNFIGIFTDFQNQDKRNQQLKFFSENKTIQKVWNYYYDYIFWPRFNAPKRFETWARPQLKIDSKSVFLAFSEMVECFEENFE